MYQRVKLLAVIVTSLLASADMRGMLSQERILALEKGTDPDRFGPLNFSEEFTEQDRAAATSLVSQQDHAAAESLYPISLRAPENYIENRNLIAKAVMNGYDHIYFMHTASYFQDYPLVEHLITHGADADMHLPDFIEPLDKPRYSFPLLRAKSLKMVKLLVEKGHASMQKTIDGEGWINSTLLHEACYGSCQPEVLEYYLQHSQLNINGIRQVLLYATKETPLHVWAKHSLNNPNYADRSLLPDAQKKLALLLTAGANGMCKDNRNNTPLDILNHKITKCEGGQRDPHQLYAAYTALAAQLTNAIKPQLQAQEQQIGALLKEQSSCPICFNEFAQDQPDLLTTLPCTHLFHADCVYKWIKRKGTCPTCRAAVSQ